MLHARRRMRRRRYSQPESCGGSARFIDKARPPHLYLAGLTAPAFGMPDDQCRPDRTCPRSRQTRRRRPAGADRRHRLGRNGHRPGDAGHADARHRDLRDLDPPPAYRPRGDPHRLWRRGHGARGRHRVEGDRRDRGQEDRHHLERIAGHQPADRRGHRRDRQAGRGRRFRPDGDGARQASGDDECRGRRHHRRLPEAGGRPARRRLFGRRRRRAVELHGADRVRLRARLHHRVGRQGQEQPAQP